MLTALSEICISEYYQCQQSLYIYIFEECNNVNSSRWEGKLQKSRGNKPFWMSKMSGFLCVQLIMIHKTLDLLYLGCYLI